MPYGHLNPPVTNVPYTVYSTHNSYGDTELQLQSLILYEVIFCSDSRSRCFTQSRDYISLEWGLQADKPPTFLVCHTTVSLSFPWQTILAVISCLYWRINITGNEAPFTLPIFAQERPVKESFVAEFSCCVPRWTAQYRKLICNTVVLYPIQNRGSLRTETFYRSFVLEVSGLEF